MKTTDRTPEISNYCRQRVFLARYQLVFTQHQGRRLSQEVSKTEWQDVQVEEEQSEWHRERTV